MRLHIIEPTLNNTAGHCFTLAHSLSKANAETPIANIELWVDQHMDETLLNHLNVKMHAYFSRRVRRLQVFFLLRRLLKQGDTVFLPTTSRAELTAFALLPKAVKSQGKVYFYIHQMRMDGSKGRRLRSIAKQASNAHILCTTEELAQCMRDAGFQHAKMQLCPFEIPNASPKATSFRHIIFPGIARMDKNFPFIASILKEFQENHVEIPFLIQAGPNHHGEFPSEIAAVIQQIKALEHPNLQLLCRSMEKNEYLGQFVGSICLQPYIIKEYANKISGITLDALARGCPVIIHKGIHSAELVEQYQAGICLESTNINDWINAMQHVINHYSLYQKNCTQAFNELSKSHHPMRLLEQLMQ